MSMIDPTHPVMVTAATGYVASWIVRRLLEGGCTVHAAVRDPGDSETLKYLNRLADSSDGEIKYFQADLMREGSYAEVMEGCDVVFHTACPFLLHPRDPETQLRQPAKLGTRNVLEEVNRHQCVRRVVMTSSCAAVFGDNMDLAETDNGEFTEDDWNETSSMEHLPYSYCKTLAEREAWRIAYGQKRWELVVLNPTLVLGPAINPNVMSRSGCLIKGLGDGSMRWGVPDLSFGIVDVRDLADAHIKAAWTEAAFGRNIISGHHAELWEIAKRLRERFSLQLKIPRWPIPKRLAWLLGSKLDQSLTRDYVSRNVGYPIVVSNAKSVELLGMHYRRLDDTVCDMFQQMIDRGIV